MKLIDFIIYDMGFTIYDIGFTIDDLGLISIFE